MIYTAFEIVCYPSLYFTAYIFLLYVAADITLPLSTQSLVISNVKLKISVYILEHLALSFAAVIFFLWT
jgi:hypothetical protein